MRRAPLKLRRRQEPGLLGFFVNAKFRSNGDMTFCIAGAVCIAVIYCKFRMQQCFASWVGTVVFSQRQTHSRLYLNLKREEYSQLTVARADTKYANKLKTDCGNFKNEVFPLQESHTVKKNRSDGL